jgi:hypothetical protein
MIIDIRMKMNVIRKYEILANLYGHARHSEEYAKFNADATSNFYNDFVTLLNYIVALGGKIPNENLSHNELYILQKSLHDI